MKHKSSIQDKTAVPALDKVMAILGELETRGPSLAGELIAALGLPRSSAYTLLDAMKQHKLVAQDSQGRYRLWMRLLALGQAASASLDIRDVARRHLLRLMEETGLLCHFGIMDGPVAYYILKVESRGSISVRSYEGKTLSLTRSGVGKCLLAWQPEEERERLLPELDFTAATPASITSPEALRAELERIRRCGWALDDGEDVPSVRCVAAPVFGMDGAIMGAISVVGARMQMEDERLEGLARQVTACAAAISRDLGCTTPPATQPAGAAANSAPHQP